MSPHEDTTKFNAVIRQTTGSSPFGLPLLLSFDRDVTCAEVYNAVWKSVKPFVLLNREEAHPRTHLLWDEVKSRMRIRVTDSVWKADRMLRTGFDTVSTSILPVKSGERVSDLMCLTEKEKVSSIFKCVIGHETTMQYLPTPAFAIVCLLLS